MTYEMTGKTVLITGGTSGIGKETATGLAKMGAQVVVTGRDKGRGEAGVADIKQESGNQKVDLMTADLSSQAEIHRLAQEFIERYSRLDVLVNNVGGLYDKRWETVDGIEASLAMNHLAPFLLTQLLLPVLKKSAPSRVINVTGGIPTVKIDTANLQAEKSFQGLNTYSHAKAVMMAGSYELAQKLKDSGVYLNVAYPGSAATAMTSAMTPGMVPAPMRVVWPLFRLFMSNLKPARAARSSIYLASSTEVEGVNGNYYNTKSKLTKWPQSVLDVDLRRQIWDISTKLAGIKADIAVIS